MLQKQKQTLPGTQHIGALRLGQVLFEKADFKLVQIIADEGRSPIQKNRLVLEYGMIGMIGIPKEYGRYTVDGII